MGEAAVSPRSLPSFCSAVSDLEHRTPEEISLPWRRGRTLTLGASHSVAQGNLTWFERSFSALEIIPTKFVMLRRSALSVRSKATLIFFSLLQSASQECNESKFFLKLPVHRSTST